MKLHLLFTDFPGPGRECVFVELENEAGKSVNVGYWITQSDGLVALVVEVGDDSARAQELLKANGRLHNDLVEAKNEVRRLNRIIATIDPETVLLETLNRVGPVETRKRIYNIHNVAPGCDHTYYREGDLSRCSKCGAVAPKFVTNDEEGKRNG